MLQSEGRLTIPYVGYIDAAVRIPPIKRYDECVPMLILKSSPYRSRVPVQLGTTVLDRAMARITGWQTYKSTMVTAKVAGMVEMKNNDILTIDAPLVTTKPTMILSFRCKWVRGTSGIVACSQLLSKHNCRTDRKSSYNMEVMVISTYWDLHPNSRRVGMMLRNLSAQEFRIPPKL